MLKKYAGYLVDLDGTIYVGKKRLPAGEDFIKRLQHKQIPFLILTNNATRTPEQVAETLQSHYGLQIDPGSIYTSGVAAVDYLLANHAGQTVMVIGEPALKQLVEEAGFRIVKEKAQVVLQALDRQVTYAELEAATLSIRNGGAFVVTNTDSNLPSEKGMVPGSGAITAFLKAATQSEPYVIGKPHPYIMEGALKRLSLTKEEVIMVGDNYTTDILAGIHYGTDTLLVLTGFTTAEDLKTVNAQPTYIVDSLDEWELLL